MGVTEAEAGGSLLLRQLVATGRRLWESLPAILPSAEVFDNWGGALAARYREPFHDAGGGRKLAWKGRAQPVPLHARTHVCAHITAVEYGTSPARRKAWLRRIEGGELDAAVLDRYGRGQLGLEQMAERMALHERFWVVPYHWVGLRNGDVLYNNDIARYTYHGNASNSHAIGVSAEADLPGLERQRRPHHTTLDDHLIETNRRALRACVTAAREAGAPVEWATAHRCYSPQRRGDPGEGYWREVMIPVAAELGLQVDYDFARDGGRPIPREWDPGATFDAAGRRVT